MIALDTNVLVRWIARDDPVQAAFADAILQEPFFLSPSVLVELGWVLKSTIGMDREAIALSVSQLVSLPTANVPHAANIRWALERYSTTGDWGDLIHLATSPEAEAFGTFEKRLRRQAGPNSPLPIIDLNP